MSIANLLARIALTATLAALIAYARHHTTTTNRGGITYPTQPTQPPRPATPEETL